MLRGHDETIGQRMERDLEARPAPARRALRCLRQAGQPGGAPCPWSGTSRDNRRRQHGLLLTSAHRAKGLEFDHVAILDGSWHTAGKGEDTDAPRRLYYVAMTRARKTLILARSGNSNPIPQIASQSPFSSGPASCRTESRRLLWK